MWFILILGRMTLAINELLLKPTKELAPAREAFLASYTGNKGKNRFTKVQMDAVADAILVKYFATHAKGIESWFNIITPKGQTSKRTSCRVDNP